MLQNAPPKIPTSREIAAAAGVSHSTVVRALRGDIRISQITRDRICALAAGMGHRSNPFVTAWADHRRRCTPPPALTSLVYIVCMRSLRMWEQSPAMVRFFTGAETRAAELGYRLDRMWLAEPGMTMKRLNQILLARGVRGLIIGGFSTAHGHLRLDWDEFATISQGYTLMRPMMHRTVNNYASSMDSLLHHLRRRGYQRIGLALNPAEATRVRGSWTGSFLNYQQTIDDRARVPHFSFDQEDRPAFQKWYRRHRPEVIVTVHRRVETFLKEIGLRTPEDVGIATPAWQPNASHWSGIDCQNERSGAVAVDFLARQLLSQNFGLTSSPLTILSEGAYREGLTLRNMGRTVTLPLLPKTTLVWS
jgi:LacI family transcriptional regulator